MADLGLANKVYSPPWSDALRLTLGLIEPGKWAEYDAAIGKVGRDLVLRRVVIGKVWPRRRYVGTPVQHREFQPFPQNFLNVIAHRENREDSLFYGLLLLLRDRESSDLSADKWGRQRLLA